MRKQNNLKIFLKSIWHKPTLFLWQNSPSYVPYSNKHYKCCNWTRTYTYSWSLHNIKNLCTRVQVSQAKSTKFSAAKFTKALSKTRWQHQCHVPSAPTKASNDHSLGKPSHLNLSNRKSPSCFTLIVTPVTLPYLLVQTKGCREPAGTRKEGCATTEWRFFWKSKDSSNSVSLSII